MRLNLKIGDRCVVVYWQPGADDFEVVPGTVESVRGSGVWTEVAFGRPIQDGNPPVLGRAFEDEGQARKWVAEQTELIISVF